MGLMSILKLLFALLIGVTCMEILDPDEGGELDPARFSTKTAYRYCSLSSFDDGTLKQLDSCKLVHINAVFRHGTRSPSSKDVSNSRDIYTRLLASQGASLPVGFRDLPIPFISATDKGLLPVGLEELYQLGQRIRTSNPTWFTHSPNITFYTSSSSRAVLSARSFYHGIYNLSRLDAEHPDEVEEYLHKVPEDIQTSDHLLRFFAFCTKYYQGIRKNKLAYSEHWKFFEGPEMKQVLQEFLSKHHLPALNFSTADMYNLYLTCSHDVAVFSNTKSPWCSLLQAHHQPVLEYLMELKHYWTKSYGYELNYVSSCPLVAEVLVQIREAALNFKQSGYDPSNPELHRASFWFGHAETLLPMFAVFGLFNDSVGHDHPQKLYADGFEKWLEKVHAHPPTMFRTSHLIPFAGNLALELYYCGDCVSSQNSDPLAGFFVLPLVNNRTVAWPLASPIQPPTVESPGAPFAPLSTVLKHFGSCMPGVYDDDAHCLLPEKE